MDILFERDGIEMLRWTDKNGDTWEAEFEDVKLFGKECFENYPRYEDFLWNWSVTYNNPDENGLLPEPTDEDYEYADSFFNL